MVSHVPPLAMTSAVGYLSLQHLLLRVLCPVLLTAKEKAPVSFKGEKKKKIETLIYMFSHLIIYFILAVSLGQIFHSNVSKNPPLRFHTCHYK